jgi:hypothetical protein
MLFVDRSKLAASAIILLSLGLGSTSALAMQPMQTVDIQGAQFVSGGVGKAERAQLLERATHYDVVVSFARASDGAYLSEATVTLTRHGSRAPIQLTTEGPLLLARLQEGEYELSATIDGWQPVHHSLTIDRDHAQKAIYLTFEPSDD